MTSPPPHGRTPGVVPEAAPEAVPEAGDAAATYAAYLRIEELLGLQQPRSAGPEHDEMLFIVIHQVYELWFKQVLWELDHAVELLDADEPIRAGHTLKRVLTILKVLVSQMDVLETMTPLEFLSFRARLDRASGFQSTQFRELEFLLGHKDPAAIERAGAGAPSRARLERRLAGPSLWDAFTAHLGRSGATIPVSTAERDVTRPVAADPAMQTILVGVYRSDPVAAGLCERFVDLDEGLQEWRYRHVKMVERTIGSKPGTGGSPGAAYLQSTLGQPVFPDLWAIRSQL